MPASIAGATTSDQLGAGRSGLACFENACTRLPPLIEVRLVANIFRKLHITVI